MVWRIDLVSAKSTLLNWHFFLPVWLIRIRVGICDCWLRFRQPNGSTTDWTELSSLGTVGWWLGFPVSWRPAATLIKVGDRRQETRPQGGPKPSAQRSERSQSKSSTAKACCCCCCLTATADIEDLRPRCNILANISGAVSLANLVLHGEC